jgi:glycosyltransferase involved in cell wall biosynthesis
VTQKELDALYHLCRVFFFPSLYEGLGIPVLEALGCGAPVVAANTSSIPEFAGDAARLFDPRAPEKAGETLAEALREPRDFGRVRRLAQAQKFTWSATATLACQAIESAVPPRTSRLMQRRVAWVSPLPPAPTGIADYSTEVLQTLAGRFDIELIVDPALDQAADSLTAQFPVLRADEAASRHDARPYDLFIYQLGNSHFHSYMLPLMFRYRGLVVMHDYFLGGLVLPLIRAGQWPGTLAEEVERDGHPELARSLRRRAITEVDALDGAPLNRRILKLAEMVAVHSNWALQRTRALVSAPVVKLCPAVRMPPPRTRSAERARLGLPADAFVVSTIGVVGPAKRIPSLLRAVAALPEGMRRQIVLPIVGPGPDEHLQELKHLARDLGLEPALRLTGRVPLEDLTAHARAADVCVQLRYPTRGESSAALLRELAAGAACIISDHGSIAEVAAEAVLRVRVPDHEVEDLANALRQLYEHPQLREALGKRAAEYARSHHRLELLAEQYANLIELMAARHMAGDWAWQQEACHALMHISQEQEARRVLEKWAELRVGGKTASHDL